MMWLLAGGTLWALSGIIILGNAHRVTRGVHLHKVWIDGDGLLWVKPRRFSKPRTYAHWEQETFRGMANN
jgi:hypothetical protein